MRYLILLMLCWTATVKAQDSGAWYKTFTGKVGSYPVKMHLHKAGRQYHGYYYYQSSQKPLMLIGEDSTTGGMIQLRVLSGPFQELFRVRVVGSGLEGQWLKNEYEKPLGFRAQQVATKPVMQYVAVSGARRLFAGREVPGATFSAATIWPVEHSRVSAAIRASISSFFTKDTGSASPDQLLQTLREAYFASYLAAHAGASADSVKDRTALNSADQTKRVMVAYHGTVFLSAAMFAYTYAGGAHGNYGTAYTVFDMLQGRKLELSHVLSTNGRKALPRLLAAAFRKQYQLEAGAPLTRGGLFDETIKPTNNFFVTGKALGFSYTPYEIGPYAMGEIVLLLPFTQLRGLLQPAFVQSLKKN